MEVLGEEFPSVFINYMIQLITSGYYLIIDLIDFLVIIFTGEALCGQLIEGVVRIQTMSELRLLALFHFYIYIN